MDQYVAKHFVDLRAMTNAALEKIGTKHRVEQMGCTWLYGALGQGPSNVMFICENPSMKGVRRAHRGTIEGDGPDGIEAQWWGSPKNPAAKRFRTALCQLGLKTTPPSSPGGWQCYITNAIKEADVVKEHKKRCRIDVNQQVWSDILAWELEQVKPRYVFAVGGKSYRAIKQFQKQKLLPPFLIHQIWHYTSRGTDKNVIQKIVQGVRYAMTSGT